MVNINDQVLGELGLDLGMNGQIAGAVLAETIQPIALMEDYRKVYELLNLTDSTTGGPGDVVGTFRPGDRKSWLIRSGIAIAGGAAGDLDWNITVLDRFGTFVPVARVQTKDVDQRMFVDGVTRDSMAPVGHEFVPGEIVVPSGGELRIDISAFGGGIIPLASLTARFMALVTPPVRRFDLVQPTSSTYP